MGAFDFLEKIPFAPPPTDPVGYIYRETGNLPESLEAVKNPYRTAAQGLSLSSSDEIEALIRSAYGDGTYGENVGEIIL